MANIDAPHGFQVFDKTRRVNIYPVATAPVIAVHPGDMVQSANTGLASAKLGTKVQIYTGAVIPATPGDAYPLLGAAVGCFDEKMNPILYIAVGRVGDGTTAGYVAVADDPEQLFEAQADGAITAANMDLNHEITSVALSAGNTYTGRSTQEIASASSNVTATIPLRLMGQAFPADDSIASAGCRWICKINPDCHYYGAGTAI